MLPTTVVTVDERLNVLKKLTRVSPTDPLGQSNDTRRFERDYDRLFSQSLEVVEDLLRESGDIARTSRLKPLSQPGDQIARIDLLLAEVGPDDDFRRLVIVEDKLSTNREGRRDVLAQILEYAHRVQTSLTVDEFPHAVADWVDEHREDIIRGMRRGDFLLIICGDQIDSSLIGLVQSYLDRMGPTNLSDLVLVAMPIYSDSVNHVLVPYVAGGTERARRDLTVRIEVQNSSGVPLDTRVVQVSETPHERPEGPRELDPDAFMANWRAKQGDEAANAWREFVASVSSSNTGCELRHFASGGPYLCLANTPLGSIDLVRLATSAPLVRDLLNKSVWESDPRLHEVRQRFRDALLKLPGASIGGTAGRVSVPVKVFAANHHEVAAAIAELATGLRSVSPSIGAGV